jgi:hypothetical protein
MERNRAKGWHTSTHYSMRKELSQTDEDSLTVKARFHDLPLYKRYMVLQHFIDWAEGQKEVINEEFLRQKLQNRKDQLDLKPRKPIDYTKRKLKDKFRVY